MARPRTDIEPRIVEAARKAFRERGVDGASLRAIAKAARTSIGMIYYYYPTKDDLFFAVVERTYEKVVHDLGVALVPDAKLEDRFLRLYERLARLNDEEVEMLRLLVREALVSSSRFERLRERFLRGHVPLVLKAIMEGLADGTFDSRLHPVIILLATFALGGPPQLVRRALGERIPVPGVPAGTELAKELLGVLLHGVAAKRAS